MRLVTGLYSMAFACSWSFLTSIFLFRVSTKAPKSRLKKFVRYSGDSGAFKKNLDDNGIERSYNQLMSRNL